MEVDLVYTWVDGSCTQHQALLEEHAKVWQRCRYANNNEILFSLYSVYQYAPWVRRVFIVIADYQQLDVAMLPGEIRKKIVFVKHSQIIDQHYLPTFNNRCIEACLHKIPDLSEHFLYLNDDMFFGNKVAVKDFFSPSGNAYILTDYFAKQCWRCDALFWLSPRDRSIRKTRQLAFGLVGKAASLFSLYTVSLHQLYPCRKSQLMTLWSNKKAKAAMIRCLADRTRNYNSIIPIMLMQFYGSLRNTFQIKQFKDHLYFDLKTKKSIRRYHAIERKKPKIFCINNDVKVGHEALEKTIPFFLANYFKVNLVGCEHDR